VGGPIRVGGTQLELLGGGAHRQNRRGQARARQAVVEVATNRWSASERRAASIENDRARHNHFVREGWTGSPGPAKSEGPGPPVGRPGPSGDGTPARSVDQRRTP